MGFGFQCKITGFKTAIHDLALYFGLANSIAEAVFGMSIAEGIYVDAVNKIGFTLYAHGQVAGGAGQAQLALATGGFYGLQGFLCIRTALFFLLRKESGGKREGSE